MNEKMLNLTDTEELRAKHEKLWFDVILRMLEENIRVNSAIGLSLLKSKFLLKMILIFHLISVIYAKHIHVTSVH